MDSTTASSVLQELVTQDNETSEHQYYPDFSQIESVRVFFVVLYLLIIVCAIAGNALVFLTVLRQKTLHNSVNFLICNLAVSDMLVGAFVAPAKLIELTASAEHRIFGDALCTCLLFSQSLTIFSTIMTLLVVACERSLFGGGSFLAGGYWFLYLVIVHPLRSRRWKKGRRMRMLLGTSWSLALLLSSPNLLQARGYEMHLKSQWGSLHRAGCTDNYDELIHVQFRQGYFLFLFVLLYCVPALVISYVSAKVVSTLSTVSFPDAFLLHRRESTNDKALQTQTENRKKVAFMMIVVNLAFLVCWSPYFLTTMTTQFIRNFFEDGHFYLTMLCINACGFLNSAINPFIYLMAPRFRQSYYQTLKDLTSCVWHRSVPPSTSSRPSVGTFHSLSRLNNSPAPTPRHSFNCNSSLHNTQNRSRGLRQSYPCNQGSTSTICTIASASPTLQRNRERDQENGSFTPSPASSPSGSLIGQRRPSQKFLVCSVQLTSNTVHYLTVTPVTYTTLGSRDQFSLQSHCRNQINNKLTVPDVVHAAQMNPSSDGMVPFRPSRVLRKTLSAVN